MRIFALLGCALFLAGCGQHLIVRNLDPTYERAEIVIDEQSVGEVAYQETMKVPLEPGRYQVRVRYPEDAKPSKVKPPALDVVIINDAVLTLLPLPSK